MHLVSTLFAAASAGCENLFENSEKSRRKVALMPEMCYDVW